MTTGTGSVIQGTEVSSINLMRSMESHSPMAASTLDMTEQLGTNSVESVAFGVIKLVVYDALYISGEAQVFQRSQIQMFSYLARFCRC
jgi:hypothetical protein